MFSTLSEDSSLAELCLFRLLDALEFRLGRDSKLLSERDELGTHIKKEGWSG
jgi:hypothetical protein